MKDFSETNIFFASDDNCHCSHDITLPFLEGDLLTIIFQYVFLDPEDVNLTIGELVEVEYQFIVKRWNNPVKLLDFIWHFSNFWVCNGVGLIQSNYVDWQSIRIINETAKKRVLSSYLNPENPKYAYHFWHFLDGITGQVDDERVLTKNPYLFDFLNRKTKKVVASTEVFFVSALLLIHDSDKFYSNIIKYFLDQQSINFIKNFTKLDFNNPYEFEFYLQTIENNFTKPFSLKINPLNYLTLEYKKEASIQPSIEQKSIDNHFNENVLPKHLFKLFLN